MVCAGVGHLAKKRVALTAASEIRFAVSGKCPACAEFVSLANLCIPGLNAIILQPLGYLAMLYLLGWSSLGGHRGLLSYPYCTYYYQVTKL